MEVNKNFRVGIGFFPKGDAREAVPCIDTILRNVIASCTVMPFKNPTTELFELLKQEIMSGEYPPSSPLNEVRLSTQYSVSRNTVKKVLLMLENEDLVSIEINKGAKVKSVSIDEVREFLELRVPLECFIVEKTVPVISREALTEMGKILKTMKCNVKERNLLEYSKNNFRFHEIIYTACPNKAAVEITTRLKMQMRRYNSRTVLVPGRDVSSFEEHAEILKAFRARDVHKAKELIERHILNVKKALEENLALIFYQ